MRPMRHRLLSLGFGLTAAISLTVPGTVVTTAKAAPDLSSATDVSSEPVYHEGAPQPVPFGPQDYVGYISDISSYTGGFYYDVVKGFSDVRENHPEIMDENLDKAVDINNNATEQEIATAQRDAVASSSGPIYDFVNAMGDELGAHMQAAFDEHRLPKTSMLLNAGYLSRAGGIASSMGVEKLIFNYPRPYAVAPDRIVFHEDGEHDIYGDLSPSRSFPSGHTNQASWSTTLLAAILPEAAPQILARGSEAGYSRIVLGVHYPLDVMGGRMTGQAAAADRWNDPKMREALTAAGQEIRAELEWRTGKKLSEAIVEDTPYRSTQDAVSQYTDRMDYGFDTVGNPDAEMIVPQAAPDLLINAYPKLNWGQRAEILKATANPAGAPLDDQSEAGSWQRLNLARAFAATVTVNPDGSVTVVG